MELGKALERGRRPWWPRLRSLGTVDRPHHPNCIFARLVRKGEGKSADSGNVLFTPSLSRIVVCRPGLGLHGRDVRGSFPAGSRDIEFVSRDVEMIGGFVLHLFPALQFRRVPSSQDVEVGFRLASI